VDIKASVKPSALNIAKVSHLFGAFDHMETEISARWVVRFCEQSGDTWDDFKRADLVAFYQEKLGANETFHFNRLIRPGSSFSIVHGSRPAGGGWLTEIGDKLRVEPDFVLRCIRGCTQ